MLRGICHIFVAAALQSDTPVDLNNLDGQLHQARSEGNTIRESMIQAEIDQAKPPGMPIHVFMDGANGVGKTTMARAWFMESAMVEESVPGRTVNVEWYEKPFFQHIKVEESVPGRTVNVEWYEKPFVQHIKVRGYNREVPSTVTSICRLSDAPFRNDCFEDVDYEFVRTCDRDGRSLASTLGTQAYIKSPVPTKKSVRAKDTHRNLLGLDRSVMRPIFEFLRPPTHNVSCMHHLDTITNHLKETESPIVILVFAADDPISFSYIPLLKQRYEQILPEDTKYILAMNKIDLVNSMRPNYLRNAFASYLDQEALSITDDGQGNNFLYHASIQRSLKLTNYFYIFSRWGNMTGFDAFLPVSANQYRGINELFQLGFAHAQEITLERKF